MKLQTSLLIVGMTLALLTGAANANLISVTYNYEASAAVYPEDDPITGNQYRASGHVTQKVNFGADPFEIDSSLSRIKVFTGENRALSELTATDETGDFAFSVYLNLPNDLTAPSTFKFIAGLNDVVAQDDSNTFEFAGGGVFVPGGLLYNGVRQDPTFRVIGSISLTEVPGVPLPATAPMFGAALLALGAVGYGVKRKKAAANA